MCSSHLWLIYCCWWRFSLSIFNQSCICFWLPGTVGWISLACKATCALHVMKRKIGLATVRQLLATDWLPGCVFILFLIKQRGAGKPRQLHVQTHVTDEKTSFLVCLCTILYLNTFKNHHNCLDFILVRANRIAEGDQVA